MNYQTVEQITAERDTLRAELDALKGQTIDRSVDKAFARFTGVSGKGPDAPYPGMIEAFENHYGQDFRDKDWRKEAACWAASWHRAVHRPAPAQSVPEHPAPFFQSRVKPWLLVCFGEAIASDRGERNRRFLEEAIELVQSLGCSANEAHQLVDYVFGRPVGEPRQEVGGVMVTLAALCLASGLDMHADGEVELQRISAPEAVLKIRAKQAEKPKHSPLPEAPSQSVPEQGAVEMNELTQAAKDVLAERRRQTEVEGWTPEHDDEHKDGQLALAAACYAHHVNARAWVIDTPFDTYTTDGAPNEWPWEDWGWKPSTPRRDLVKAAALILAEIERLDRMATAKPEVR